MKKVKLLSLHGSNYGDPYAENDSISILANVTEWDEVTDDDFEALRLWTQEENNKYSGTKYFLLEEHQIDPTTIAPFLAKAKVVQEKVLEQQEKAKAKAAKREAKQRKLEETKEERKKAKEIKQLEALKKKHDGI